MSKRRRKRAFLIPQEEWLCFHPNLNEVHFLDTNDPHRGEIWIKNCRLGDLVPNSIVVLRPVRGNYWERVT
jgi:hypothetical protein